MRRIAGWNCSLFAAAIPASLVPSGSPEDPRRGGIAPDQFLAYTTRLDGSPLEPFLVANFESLRLTGDGAH